MNHRWLAIAAAIPLLLAAACSGPGFGSVPVGVMPVTAGASRSSLARDTALPYAFAPYVDMDAFPEYDLGKAADATGTRYYTMAFMQSFHGSQCRGAWAGSILPSDPTQGAYFRDQLEAMRARGGDGILSFGGAYGRDLSVSCTTPKALAAAYESAIDYYTFTHVDFDIEGSALADGAAVARRAPALAIVQSHYAARGKHLVISYTVPVEPIGLSSQVLAAIRQAMDDKVNLGIVNIMTMDFGDYYAPSPQGKMATLAIEAAKASVKQLRAMNYPFGGHPYSSIGITPMIGINDATDEIFQPADARQLLSWAQRNGIGRIAFWAAQRDVSCPNGAATVSDTCSGIAQSPGEFQKIFAAF